ncbi:hypothetical protein ACFL1R_12545 [Candidatus Latescibacterota bacterium]
MKTTTHIKCGIPIAVSIFFIWDMNNALYFFFGTVLVDVDHILDYIVKSKDLNIKHMFEFYERLAVEFRTSYYLGLSLFHTIEFFILIAWLALNFIPLRFVLSGLAYHHLLDAIYLKKINFLFKRSYSLFFYLFKILIMPDRQFTEMRKKETHIIKDIIDTPSF